MLKLKPAATDLTRLEIIPGVRVHMKPISVAMVLVGRDEAGKVFAENRVLSEADAEAGNPNVGTHAGIALVRSLVHAGIVEWEGVGDAEGNPAPVTPENIDLLLDEWRAYDAFDRLYVGPALDRGAEKKRLKALAEWHFADEGQEYCAACGVQCEACPYTENAPQTADGISAWAVIRACGAQVRYGKNAPYGLDYGSVLMMADAMGAKSALLAEALPAIEAIMMGAYRDRAERED